jgi:hypothetical protein
MNLFICDVLILFCVSLGLTGHLAMAVAEGVGLVQRDRPQFWKDRNIQVF